MDNVFRVLPLCTLLLGCAAEQARDVPLRDLACDEDDDCEIVTGDDVHKCGPVDRPYAISKAAYTRYQRGRRTLDMTVSMSGGIGRQSAPSTSVRFVHPVCSAHQGIVVDMRISLDGGAAEHGVAPGDRSPSAPAAERQGVGQTPTASCLGLTVPRMRVHWQGACRTVEHSGKAVGEDTGPHREEVRAVSGLGVG